MPSHCSTSSSDAEAGVVAVGTAPAAGQSSGCVAEGNERRSFTLGSRGSEKSKEIWYPASRNRMLVREEEEDVEAWRVPSDVLLELASEHREARLLLADSVLRVKSDDIFAV